MGRGWALIPHQPASNGAHPPLPCHPATRYHLKWRTGAAKIVLRTQATWISLYLQQQKRKTPPPTGRTKREIHLHKSTEKRRGGDPSQFHLRTISLNFLKEHKGGQEQRQVRNLGGKLKSDQRHSQSRMAQKDWQGKGLKMSSYLSLFGGQIKCVSFFVIRNLAVLKKKG